MIVNVLFAITMFLMVINAFLDLVNHRRLQRRVDELERKLEEKA